jgi:hypothetical protein
MLSADTGISRQTEGYSFGDHLTSESVSVTPSSVYIEEKEIFEEEAERGKKYQEIIVSLTN